MWKCSQLFRTDVKILTRFGLTASGDWQAVRHGFCCQRVVMAVFRARCSTRSGRRGGVGPSCCRRCCGLSSGSTCSPAWGIHARAGGTYALWSATGTGGVITYLARYLRGGPLKNARLVAWDGDRVTFTCRAPSREADGAQPGLQQMTLPVADFLQRWLHVRRSGAAVCGVMDCATIHQEALADETHAGQPPAPWRSL